MTAEFLSSNRHCIPPRNDGGYPAYCRCFTGVFNGLLEGILACAAQEYPRSKRKYNRLADRVLSRNGIGEN